MPAYRTIKAVTVSLFSWTVGWQWFDACCPDASAQVLLVFQEQNSTHSKLACFFKKTFSFSSQNCFPTDFCRKLPIRLLVKERMRGPTAVTSITASIAVCANTARTGRQAYTVLITAGGAEVGTGKMPSGRVWRSVVRFDHLEFHWKPPSWWVIHWDLEEVTGEGIYTEVTAAICQCLNLGLLSKEFLSVTLHLLEFPIMITYIFVRIWV